MHVNTVVVHLPPEVCGCLSLAQKHLDASRRIPCRWKWRERKRRHEAKVQKLVARASKLLNRTVI